jgi:hypothetical protein
MEDERKIEIHKENRRLMNKIKNIILNKDLKSDVRANFNNTLKRDKSGSISGMPSSSKLKQSLVKNLIDKPVRANDGYVDFEREKLDKNIEPIT